MKQAYYPLHASEGLQVEETATEVIVYDSKNQEFHFLNETAHTIFKACNGSNKISDIALILSRKFNSEDLASLENDVEETIATLQDKGLIMFVADELQPDHTATALVGENPLLAVSVSGISMFPALLAGDKVLVKRSSLEGLNEGDIIVWSDDSGERVAHRVVSIDSAAKPPLITTKGDRTMGPDPAIAFDRVIGKIVAVLRDGEVRWMSELDHGNNNSASAPATQRKEEQPLASPAPPKQRPSYKRMKVLDLRDISLESIRNIESVEDVSLVLLSPDNAHAWADVPAKDVKTIYTAPKDYRIYTGQPELLPELLEFLEAPLRLIVSGQLFVTAFDASQISQAFKEVILLGQAYVSSDEAKAVLESLTNIVSGEIRVVPREHARWIGESVLGPEYVYNSRETPLVAVGNLSVSERVGELRDSISLFS